MAGQTVSEGFLQWRISVSCLPATSVTIVSCFVKHQPIMRRLITRCLGLIPSMAVAIGVGRSGVDSLLVASQVVLSIVLPFIVLPLLWLTSSKTIMSVRKTAQDPQESHGSTVHPNSSLELNDGAAIADPESAEDQIVDYSNNKTVSFIGYFIWVIILAANVYAIVSLGMGIAT